jgi:4-hydroxybenzoate polyprenyltransferase
MRKKLIALFCLSRIKEFLWFVTITTLLGASAAGGSMSWRLLLVLAANLLAVGFAFMINDVEDAADDALNPAKVNRNPVSAQVLSARAGYIASFTVAGLAALAYLPLGLIPFLIGLACLAVSFLYSWKAIRLKTIPVLDMVSHCLMLAGFQFLTACFTFGPAPVIQWLFPFIFLVAISVYGVLFNQMRDYEYDKQAGLTHTSILVGPRNAQILMAIALGVGLVAVLITLFVQRLIPFWVLELQVILSAIFIFSPLLKARDRKSLIELQHSFQKPLEIATASALVIQYVGTWAYTYFGTWAYTYFRYLISEFRF